jgi:hypothetical protein
MIIVRDIFQLHFGKAREAIAVLKEGREHLKEQGYVVGHLLADVTGEYYTLVMESTYESLADFEAAMSKATQDPEWRNAYTRFTPLVHSGRREIFRIVD